MLTLSRSKGQTVLIGDEIRVTVVEVKKGGVVRLGFEAPKTVKILREEIINRGTTEFM